MKSLVHALTSTFAMLIIATFWVSTVVSELFLGPQAVAVVKQAIAAYGVYALVLMMASAGASGMALAKARKGRLVDAKKWRMRFIAANGFLVLIPCALALNALAAAGEFSGLFYLLQALELSMGLVQLILMSRNFREGLILAGRRPLAPRSA